MNRKQMKRSLLGLLASAALVTPAAAVAGSWTVGPQTINFSTTTTHTLGDGSNIRGGIPPAFGYMAPDVPSDFTESNWIHAADEHAAGNFRTVADGADEAKARFDCEFGLAAQQDPIVSFGSALSSHMHHFVGKRLDLLGLQPKDATYANLRGAGYSGCYGGPLNRTLYWEPAVRKTLSNGATVDVKLQSFVSYYIGGLLNHTGDIYDPAEAQVWPRGWDTISGFNMSDPTNSRLANIIAAANTAAGHTKYAAPGGDVTKGVSMGFLGWYCETPVSGNGSVATSPVPGADHQPWLRNADGTPTLNCAATAADGSSGHIIADLETMGCWDGVNLDSPDGRGHMISSLVDLDTGKEVCPEHWYKVPQFEAKVFFYHTGQSDYTNWWLSSDRMDANPANWYRNGETMHFDLIPAWSYGTITSPGVFLKFMQNCVGVTIKFTSTDTPLAGNPNECGYGAIDSGHQIYVNEAPPSGNPGSPNPIVNLNPDFTNNLNRYIKAPVGTAAPNAVHHKH
jgi:hypothetical protein